MDISCRSERLYSSEDVCEMLEKAKSLGFSLETDTELLNLTLAELEILVTRKQ